MGHSQRPRVSSANKPLAGASNARVLKNTKETITTYIDHVLLHLASSQASQYNRSQEILPGDHNIYWHYEPKLPMTRQEKLNGRSDFGREVNMAVHVTWWISGQHHQGCQGFFSWLPPRCLTLLLLSLGCGWSLLPWRLAFPLRLHLAEEG